MWGCTQTGTRLLLIFVPQAHIQLPSACNSCGRCCHHPSCFRFSPVCSSTHRHDHHLSLLVTSVPWLTTACPHSETPFDRHKSIQTSPRRVLCTHSYGRCCHYPSLACSHLYTHITTIVTAHLFNHIEPPSAACLSGPPLTGTNQFTHLHPQPYADTHVATVVATHVLLLLLMCLRLTSACGVSVGTPIGTNPFTRPHPEPSAHAHAAHCCD